MPNHTFTPELTGSLKEFSEMGIITITKDNLVPFIEFYRSYGITPLPDIRDEVACAQLAQQVVAGRYSRSENINGILLPDIDAQLPGEDITGTRKQSVIHDDDEDCCDPLDEELGIDVDDEEELEERTN